MHTRCSAKAIELGVNDGNRATILQRLKDDAQYPARYAFRGESAPIQWDNVIKAIAAFERTLVSAGSRYDQARAGSVRSPTSNAARPCSSASGARRAARSAAAAPTWAAAPSSGAEGSDGTPGFHNIGLFNVGGTGAYPEGNQGLIEFTGSRTWASSARPACATRR